MRLDTIALGLVVALAIMWVAFAFAGLVAAWPYGLIGLVVLGVIGYLIYGVIRQKMDNAEDDYYEKNVEK